MKNLPQEALEAWKNRDGAIILTTVDKNGIPNSIYATCVGLYKKRQIAIADNYFDKTRKNIFDGSKGSVLFITQAGKAYQIKGTFDYEKKGPAYEFMKSWNPEQHPGHAVTLLNPEEIFSGAQRIC